MPPKMTYRPRPDFIESEQYADTRDLIDKAVHRNRKLYIHILHGMSGIGKTQVGRKLIASYRSSDSPQTDGFEVDCSSPVEMGHSLTRIIRYKRIVDIERQENGQDILEILSKIPERTVLFVLDYKPEDPDEERDEELNWFWKMIEEFEEYEVPSYKNLILLITTPKAPPKRFKPLEDGGFQLNIRMMTGFTTPELQNFLEKHDVAPSILNHDGDGLNRLNEMYGGHPLALLANIDVFQSWESMDNLDLHVDEVFRLTAEAPTTDANLRPFETIKNNLKNMGSVNLPIWKIIALLGQGYVHKDIIMSVIICYIKHEKAQNNSDVFGDLPDEDDGAFERYFFRKIEQTYAAIRKDMLRHSFVSEVREGRDKAQIYMNLHAVVYQSLNQLIEENERASYLRLALIALSRVVTTDSRFWYYDDDSKVQHAMRHSEALLGKLDRRIERDLTPFAQIAVFELVSSVAYAKTKQPGFESRAQKEVAKLTQYIKQFKSLCQNRAATMRPIAGQAGANLQPVTPAGEEANLIYQHVSEFLVVFPPTDEGRIEHDKTEQECVEHIKFTRFTQRDFGVLKDHLQIKNAFVSNLFMRISNGKLDDMTRSQVVLPIDKFMQIYPLEVWAQMLVMLGDMNHERGDDDGSLRQYEEAYRVYDMVREIGVGPNKTLLRKIIHERDRYLEGEAKRLRTAEPADPHEYDGLKQRYEVLSGCTDKAYEKGYLRSEMGKDTYHKINCYEHMIRILGYMYAAAARNAAGRAEYLDKIRKAFASMKELVKEEEERNRENCYSFAIEPLGEALSFGGICGLAQAVRVMAYSLFTKRKALQKGSAHKDTPYPELLGQNVWKVRKLLKHLKEWKKLDVPVVQDDYSWLECLCLHETCNKECTSEELQKYLMEVRDYIDDNDDVKHNFSKSQTGERGVDAADDVLAVLGWAKDQIVYTPIVHADDSSSDDSNDRTVPVGEAGGTN